MTGSVFRRGSTWTAKVELPRDPLTGQRRTRWLGGYDTKKQAERAALELRAEMLTGTWAQAPRELTVARFLLDQWLPLVEGRDLKESTKAAYQMTVTSYVIPRIGHLPLAEVTPMVIERLLSDLRTQGRTLRPGGLSAKTRRNVHGVLHKAFGDALRNGLINRNPLDAVIPPRDTSTEPAARRMAIWTPAQVQAFLDHAAGNPFGPILHLLLLTGARRGELVALLWDDIDLDTGTLDIRRSAVIAPGRGVIISSPKTRHGHRTVHVDTATVAMLRRHRANQAAHRLAAGPAWHDEGLVFPSRDGTLLHPGLVSKAFTSLTSTAALPSIRLHDLRHTHASVLLAGRVPITEVSERLGHANPSITLNVYSHVLPGRGAEVAQRAADLLLGTTPPST